jgi:PAS domain-containing protein
MRIRFEGGLRTFIGPLQSQRGIALIELRSFGFRSNLGKMCSMEASVAPEKHPADQQQEHEVSWPASAPADSVSTQEVLTATKTDGVRRTESKLRQDEEELRRIIDLIPQTILVLNPDGKAIYANLVARLHGHGSRRSTPHV